MIIEIGWKKVGEVALGGGLVTESKIGGGIHQRAGVDAAEQQGLAGGCV